MAYDYRTVTKEASPDVMAEPKSYNDDKRKHDRELNSYGHRVLSSIDFSSSQFVRYSRAVKSKRPLVGLNEKVEMFNLLE